MVLFTNRDVVVTHLDPTFFSSGKTPEDMHGQAVYHYLDHPTLFAGTFYQEMWGFSYAIKILTPLLTDQNISSSDLVTTFEKLILVFFMDHNQDELDKLRDAYRQKKQLFTPEEYRILQRTYYFSVIYLAKKGGQKAKLSTLCDEAKIALEDTFNMSISNLCK